MICPHQYAVWMVAAAAVIQAGCGGNPYGAVPVSGGITFAGQRPPADCVVYFLPSTQRDAGTNALPPRPGRGFAGKDGLFVVSSFKEGDGLLPGTYDVRVECWRTPPQASHATPDVIKGASFVPVAFTPPPLTVQPGQAAIRYDLDVPAPPSTAGKDSVR